MRGVMVAEGGKEGENRNLVGPTLRSDVISNLLGRIGAAYAREIPRRMIPGQYSLSAGTKGYLIVHGHRQR